MNKKDNVIAVAIVFFAFAAVAPVFAAQTITGTTINATTLNATTIVGTYTGTLGAANVSAGIFGSNTGNGTFVFPAGVQLNAASNTGYVAMNNPSTYWGIMGNYGINDWRIGWGSPTALTGWNLRWDASGNVWANASLTSVTATISSTANPGLTVGNGTTGYAKIGSAGWYDDGSYFSPLGTRPFYVRSSVGTSYIYSPNIYIGDGSSANNVYFRNETLSGSSWSLTAAGDFSGSSITTTGAVNATGIVYTSGSFRITGSANTIQDSNQFYCNNAAACYFNWSSTGATNVGNAAGVYMPGPLHVAGASTLDSSIIFTQGSATRNVGIIGTYDPTRIAAIWSMGAAYQIGTNGSAGNLYGLSYSYEPDYGGAGNNPGAISGLGHQMQWRSNGATQTAIGSGIWTNGAIQAVGNIYPNNQTTYGLKNNDLYVDTINSGVSGDALELGYRTSGDVRIYNGDLTMQESHYIYPGSITAGYSLQKSWYLASSPSWGLYTNTSLYAAGGLYTSGGYGILGPQTTYGSISFPQYKNSYYGILMGQAATNPNFMWDTSGNGGIYYETATAAGINWAMYYLKSNGHWSINTSTDYGYTFGVNGSIYSPYYVKSALMYAEMFYDSNNTSYYVNPDGTSVMWHISTNSSIVALAGANDLYGVYASSNQDGGYFSGGRYGINVSSCAGCSVVAEMAPVAETPKNGDAMCTDPENGNTEVCREDKSSRLKGIAQKYAESILRLGCSNTLDRVNGTNNVGLGVIGTDAWKKEPACKGWYPIALSGLSEETNVVCQTPKGKALRYGDVLVSSNVPGRLRPLDEGEDALSYQVAGKASSVCAPGKKTDSIQVWIQ